MKLDFVEVCGFRGFRDKIRIDFGAGFTVITGRNGAGKSTICDAIEFALTGSIGKYAVEKAARESIRDYIWWRGEGSPAAHYVIASFKGLTGQQFTIRRTRETGADKTPAQIEAALCRLPKPEDALQQLCKTSIIRDEWISALSVDLTETERFDLVRSALGPVEGVDYGAKAKDVVSNAEAVHTRNEANYESARLALANALTNVSEAQNLVARGGDVQAAIAIVSAATSPAPTEIAARMAAARTALTTRVARIPVFEHAISQASEILALSQVLDAPATKQVRDAARELLETATRAKVQADAQVDQAQRELEREEKLNEVATSLSLLVEHGEKLGLNSDHCPLCAAARTVEEFEAGLAGARSRIESLASGITLARSQLSAAREAAVDTNAAHANAMAAWEAIERQEADLAARERAHVELFRQHDLDLRLLKDPEGLEKELTVERDHLIELERALQTLEASQTVSRIATLDDRVTACRRDLDVAADHLAQSQAGMTAARAIERGIRRVTGEIIDERLAQISPLLNELYQRLRPHSDWRTIEYSIRGDVRRFLSLKVGDGLNPQFVFSSGQRRAVGLAFLLSVHLARAWTSWRTLVLDDPVQHIDDFRALHLVEVLAALRLDGRQIICAVEDAALADLLCRRLLSTQDEPGRRYDIDLGGEDSAAAMKRQEVQPMQKGILQDVSALHVAS